MSKRATEDSRRDRHSILNSQPVRLSKEELARSRAGRLGCFPSPELYEPEEAPTRNQRGPRDTKKQARTDEKT